MREARVPRGVHEGGQVHRVADGDHQRPGEPEPGLRGLHVQHRPLGLPLRRAHDVPLLPIFVMTQNQKRVCFN